MSRLWRFVQAVYYYLLCSYHMLNATLFRSHVTPCYCARNTLTSPLSL